MDAAIAVAICEGVAAPQNMGIGGGFIATIYIKSENKTEVLCARDRAPSASHRMMFENIRSDEGILAVGIPGELKGHGEMHRKYGRVPWKTLIQPTIDLCRSGHVVTDFLHRVLVKEKATILRFPALRAVMINPATNDVWQEGDRIKRLKLAETLEIVAREGPETMYSRNGTIAKLMVDEMALLGGIITMDDLEQYRTEWQKSITTKLKGDYTMSTVSTPGSGSILALILNILNGYKAENTVQFVHRMIEAFKFGYAERTRLGDYPNNQLLVDQLINPSYADYLRSLIWDNKTFNDVKHYGANFEIPEDHGTANMAVLTANGDAIAMTSTVNQL